MSENETAPNPFNLDALRTPQDFQKTGGVKRTTQNIRSGVRPPKDKFIRVHPFDSKYGEEVWCSHVLLFEYQFDGDMSPETFLVFPGSKAYVELVDKLKPALIVLGVTRGGSRFLWELKLPDAGGVRKSNLWAETRLHAAKIATETWIKLVPDTDAGCYQYDEPIAKLPDPDFGEEPFEKLCGIVYEKRIVETLDHEAVREHLGG